MAVERIRQVRGTGLPLRGDDIDTDRIIPARFLKSISFEGLEDHLFEDDRREAESAGGSVHPVSNPAYRGASIMIVGANFGCGSSREHAPQAIRRRGIRAVIGQSYSEIFFGNSIALGMPCVTASRETLDTLMDLVEKDPYAELLLDLDAMQIGAAGRTHSVALPAAAREAFIHGSWDATGLLLEDFDQVRAVASRLPYVSGFTL
ncbi:MAG TPA: 3-isopropylmalate dehydratase small subunit [Vicinamibacterales bacterium]|nr:3-isopropylmalate dehydratase small subunit [Vicinamibacterales bacterium]